jgi:hypothetical protein
MVTHSYRLCFRLRRYDDLVNPVSNKEMITKPGTPLLRSASTFSRMDSLSSSPRSCVRTIIGRNAALARTVRQSRPRNGIARSRGAVAVFRRWTGRGALASVPEGVTASDVHCSDQRSALLQKSVRDVTKESFDEKWTVRVTSLGTIPRSHMQSLP